MSLDKQDTCGCGSHQHDHHDHHEEAHGGCGCGSSHDSEDGCGCGGHDHQSVTLTLEDNTELVCPIIEVFDINEQDYIALLHPEDETVLLYRLFDNDDDTIDLESIDSDEEFELVSKTFLATHE